MEKANKNYNKGSEYLKTSCLKCRFNPDYSSAIPYLKLAGDEFHNISDFRNEIETREKLVKCFKNENSFWEEGNEYEKISKVQLNQLKSASEAYNSIENAFHAYINDHKYDYAIRALTKSSENFIDNDNKEEAEKTLSLAFDGINKYHVIILDKDEDISYVYECIDKYIDLLYNDEKYKKGSEIARKSAELIEKENKKEKNFIAKYYAFQAIGELLDKKEEKYKNTIKKGMNIENGIDDLNNKINKLVNLVKEKNKDNEKTISSLFYDINRNIPNSISKMLNKYIQENKNYDDNENINDNNSNNEKLTDFEEDLK